MENRFYVYVYLDSRKPGSFIYGEYKFKFEPFYIGKGQASRMYCHLCSENSSKKTNLIKEIYNQGFDPVIKKIKSSLSENAAFDLEEKLIELIGRLNLGTGPLTNVLPGGKWGSASGKENGFYGKLRSEKHKLAMKIGHEKFVLKLKTDEAYKKETMKKMLETKRENHGGLIPATFKGKKHSENTKNQMSKTHQENRHQKGEKNSQFGTCWVYNVILKENKKIQKAELALFINQGWCIGRKLKF